MWVCRGDIVEVQNNKLDRFHVKEHLQQAASDIRDGRILQSMMIEKQTAALRQAITAPLVKARELVMKDIREHDELMDGSLE
jgi:chloride channel 7